MKITICDEQGVHEAPEADLSAALASNAKAIWVDMTGPSDEDIRVMRDVFKFHPLAIEDTRNQHQRPKIEEYPDYLFGILNPIMTTPDGPTFRELDVFIGHNYVVTVHPEQEPVIDETKKRIARTGGLPHLSTGYILYVLVDVVVDGYFPILDSLGDEIEQLGDAIVVKPQQESLNELFKLKRTLNEVWRVVGPQRDMFNVLTRRDLPFIDQNTLQYYLRDVYDHLLRITDTVNTYRDTLTSIIDLYMSAVSNRLNVVVNRLTVITVCVGLLSVIVGFYGMNFQQTWPSFDTPWGVLFVLGLMTGAVALVVIVFKRLRWY
jgi:magnesium transporter